MTAVDVARDAARDVALSLRLLARQPAFAAVAILTLALGAGAPTAIFSTVHAVLLRPLPYVDADRIVRFRIESQSPRGSVAFDALPVTEALRWADNTSTLETMALFNDSAKTLTTSDGPVRLIGLAATPNLFALLGTAPAAGRPFDAATRDVRQVVLSHSTWQRYFNGNQAVVGTSITLDGDSYVVTGVMPEAFAFPSSESAFWVPLLLQTGGGRGMLLPAIAKLRPGANINAVVAEGQRLLTEGPGGDDARVQQTLVARTLQEQMVGGYVRVLWVLLAAVGLVSVIATVNIALLLLTRGASRAREFSIRLALGAGRSRLVRQLFVEGMTLAVLGGLGGLAVGVLALKALVRIAPPDLPRLDEAGLDPLVLTFTASLVILASIVFGVLSAGRVITVDAIRALARAATESSLVPSVASRRRLNGLAAAELALTVVLLVGAGLLLRSFMSLVLVDQGFESAGALAVQVTLPSARYPSPEARLAFHDRLLERARAVHGVSHAGLATSMPNRQPTGRFAYDPIGSDPFADHFTLKVAEVRMVSAGFLEAMGIPLLAGRPFTEKETEGSEAVIVLSQRLARLHFPDRDPIGAMLYSESGDRRVVGVVSDVRPASQEGTADAGAYIPLRQEKDVLSWAATITLIVRGQGTVPQVASIRSMVSSLDPEMAIFNVRTLDREVAGLVAGPRFSATALGLFALVALVMAAVGVYGVMAYSAGQRTREIGVRMALGATSGQVLRLVIRDGVVVVVTGLVAGLVAAMWLARSLTGLLHEVTAADPLALASVALLLSAIGLVAVLIPARRATRVSALAALRHD